MEDYFIVDLPADPDKDEFLIEVGYEQLALRTKDYRRAVTDQVMQTLFDMGKEARDDLFDDMPRVRKRRR